MLYMAQLIVKSTIFIKYFTGKLFHKKKNNCNLRGRQGHTAAISALAVRGNLYTAIGRKIFTPRKIYLPISGRENGENQVGISNSITNRKVSFSSRKIELKELNKALPLNPRQQKEPRHPSCGLGTFRIAFIYLRYFTLDEFPFQWNEREIGELAWNRKSLIGTRVRINPVWKKFN